MFGLRVFNLVVTDAVRAGHKNHGGGCQPRQVHGIVSRTADHVHSAVTQLFCAAADAFHQVRCKRLGWKIHHLLHIDAQPAFTGNARTGAAQVGVHVQQHRVVTRTQVHAHADLARDDVARIREHLQRAHRSTRVRRALQRHAIDLGHELAGGEQRIAAQCHRCGAGVRLHALDHHVVPALAQRTLHHADHAVVGLQHRALLDMGLEIGAHGRGGAWRSVIADGRQGLAYADALGIALGQRMLQCECAGKHARTHHHGNEARTLFIGPHHNLDGRLGLHAGIVEAAHHFQARQHAVVAVKLAARRLGVNVAARHGGRQAVVAAAAARKDVADGIDADAAAGLARPLHEQVAALAVERGEGQATYATFGRGAYFCQVHQRLPKACSVDFGFCG